MPLDSIQNIDFSPLSSCNPLTLDFWSSNHERPSQEPTIDITPLIMNTEFNFGNDFDFDGVSMYSWLQPNSDRIAECIIYSHPTQLYPWSFLSKAAKEIQTRTFRNSSTYFYRKYISQHNICRALDLADYGFVDCDLRDILLSIPSETSTEDAREIIRKVLVNEIVASVDRGGPTTGLNLEKLITQHGEIEIMDRIERINNLRKREIEQVVLGQIEEQYTRTTKYDYGSYIIVDLRELWVTAYGYEILNGLDKGEDEVFEFYHDDFNEKLSTSPTGLSQIKSSFTAMGFSLKVSDPSEFGMDISELSDHGVNLSDLSKTGVSMSLELKQSIWWTVENKGNYWDDIKRRRVKRSSAKFPRA
ncbi:MAG: hypothetical protein ACTSWQ_08310 [Candidatus Thorarchaeota archaeon]